MKVWQALAIAAALWWLLPRYRFRLTTAFVLLIALIGL